MEDPQLIASAGDFLDEDWSEAFGAQFLVDTEEVDFGGSENILPDPKGDGDAGDEGDEFSGFTGADADVPFFSPAGGFEGPGDVSWLSFRGSVWR